MPQYLYHITDFENLDSILVDGLKPSIGRHRQNCKIDIERESTDPRISLCDGENIKKWHTALYKKSPGAKIAILKVDIDGLYLKKRKWSSGYEYACWDLINPERLTVIDESEII